MLHIWGFFLFFMDAYICHLTKQYLMDRKVALCIFNTLGNEQKANRFVNHSTVNGTMLYIIYTKNLSLKKTQSAVLKTTSMKVNAQNVFWWLNAFPLTSITYKSEESTFVFSKFKKHTADKWMNVYWPGMFSRVLLDNEKGETHNINVHGW